MNGRLKPIEYKLIRSRRKSIGLNIGAGGLIVRAPYGVSLAEINDVIRKKMTWINGCLERMHQQQEQMQKLPPLTMEDIHRLADKALQVIPERVKFYAPKVGVEYGRITIRNQRTRWGSCSGKGNLNFNCLLMLTPPEVIDSIVVHELCHIKEMNHSAAFYAQVLRVFPDYWKWDKWLKENGNMLLNRMLKGA